MSNASLPPLSQSRSEMLACARLYHAKVIEKLDAGSAEAERGTLVHKIIQAYINHLVASRRSYDEQKFDELIAGIDNAEAAEILDCFKSRGAVFDPEKVLGTEMRIRLDSDWRPIEVDGDENDYNQSGEPWSAYAGTLDLVQLESPGSAIIDDFKTHWAIFDPKRSFQAKLYPLLLFCRNPQLTTVLFRLQFVRYGVAREISWQRDDLPRLKSLAHSARARQLEVHNTPTAQATASAGKHCVWCPLLATGSCPIRASNPHTAMTYEQRVEFGLWLNAQTAENDRILKERAAASPITYRDANGNEYSARYEDSERLTYPAVAALAALNSWRERTGEDLTGKLTISATDLKSLLRTKKRSELAVEIAALAQSQKSTRFKLGAMAHSEDG